MPRGVPHSKPPHPPNPAERMGQLIKSVREREGLSLRTVGERIGTSHTRVKAIETGRYPLRSEDDLITLAEALGVPAEAILGEWAKILEENFGLAPWKPRSVLAASLRREGERQAASLAAAAEFERIVDGVDFHTLCALLANDERVRSTVEYWCRQWESQYYAPRPASDATSSLTK